MKATLAGRQAGTRLKSDAFGALALVLLAGFSTGCPDRPAATALAEPAAPAVAPAPAAVDRRTDEAKPDEAPTATRGAPREPVPPSTPPCAGHDWSARPLAPLLKPGKRTTPSERDRASSTPLVFAPECTDSPAGPNMVASSKLVVEGVELLVTSASPAGSSKRGWAGNQCTFEVSLADGAGPRVRLGAQEVPPFTSINAVVRSGSAVWLSVGFNGYTAEFPGGGNRIVALDLCAGRVAWQSKDSVSNGGLLLLEDYLISPFGFTNERRFLFVLDARSGAVIQKLRVVENICPSTSWAPNHTPGQRCDAPGQAVGAATAPRVEGGLLLVDTNTGSAAFQFD